MKREKKHALILSVGLIIILGFAVYGNSLNGKFIWDDQVLIKDNPHIKSWSNISNIFAKDITASTAIKSNFYRPLQMITYMLDYSIWGLNVVGYHLTNIMLHILAALGIYWLIFILFRDNLLSLLTGLFFVVHPIHTEAVSYISGRADSLSLLFMLLCFILYIKQRSYFLMVLCFMLALLSRENSLILPALILLYHFAFKKELKIKRFMPILAIAFIYIILRLTVLSRLLPHLSSNTTLLERLPGFFVAMTNYFKLLFLPFGLHMEYGNRLFHLNEPRAILGITILSLLLIYAIRKRRPNALVSFSIFWFFIALLPQSNLYPINAYMAEHWLYLPSIGVFLISAQGLSSLYRRKETQMFTIFLTMGLLAFYSYLTIRQNNYWKEPITFYERTLKYAPDSPRVFYNIGNTYQDTGKYVDAIESYKKALQINPNSLETYNNLGTVYSAMDKHEEAIESYKKALQINPKSAKAYNNLGNEYSKIGKHDEAVASYEKALKLDPKDGDLLYNLGDEYAKLGRYEEAITQIKKVLQLNPNDGMAHYNLAMAYYCIKNYDLAIEHSDKAVESGYKVDPKFLELLKLYRK